MLRMDGYRVVIATIVSLAAICAAVLLLKFSPSGLSDVIFLTARWAFVLFCLAFTAAALHKLYPSRLTRWQLRNRRFIGISFGFTMIVHICFLLIYGGVTFPRVLHAKVSWVSAVAIAGLLVVLAMTATSFAKYRNRLRPETWKRLHTFGAYFIWTTFFISFQIHLVTPFTPIFEFSALSVLFICLFLRFLPYLLHVSTPPHPANNSSAGVGSGTDVG